MTDDDVAVFERALAADGVALFPADTVYGLAADAESERGVRRLYEIKRRPAMPSAVMFFDVEPALRALAGLGPRTRTAAERLLPGPVTLIVPNAAGLYPLASGGGTETLGIRVPTLDGPLRPLRAVERAVVQSSANVHGSADARRLEDVAAEVRAAVDVELDGGELPGTASTVVDLSRYEEHGRYEVLREGALGSVELRRALS